ncbi:MAG: EAL domain-containing protein [Pseudomonadota bacterium]
MSSPQQPNSDLQRDIHLRLLAIASWVGWLGNVVVLSVGIALLAVDELSPILVLALPLYLAVFTSMIVASRRDFYVREILYSGLLALYAMYWGVLVLCMLYGELPGLRIPLAITIPTLIVAILSHRILLALMPVQFALVYLLASQSSFTNGGLSVEAIKINTYSLTTAGLSAVIFLSLAIISWERKSTDRNLLALLRRQERIASTDPLTGLLNRRAFLDRLDTLWQQESSLILTFIDLDHFKPLNDRFGHATGDQVLKQVASRIAQSLESGTVARLGGDEFAAVFRPEGRELSIEEQIGRLHSAITADFEVSAGTVSLGASIGFANSGGPTDSLSKLLGAADTAMRRAKATRSGWARYDDQVDGAALESSELKLELKKAVRDSKIRAAVQPIADSQSHATLEYELLARWPDSGFQTDPGPDKFIHIAEQLGLLNDILWMTLEEAARALNLATTRLALNVSPAQLLAPDFLGQLLQQLERLEINPKNITLEITEEVAFRNLDENVAALERARSAGMLIALDDFGSGYSSLSMLDALPLDKLKIDQSMVQKGENNQRSADILHASVKLAKQLGLICCVEGVETKHAASVIRSLGADEVQGYWIGKPQLLRTSTPRPNTDQRPPQVAQSNLKRNLKLVS